MQTRTNKYADYKQFIHNNIAAIVAESTQRLSTERYTKPSLRRVSDKYVQLYIDLTFGPKPSGEAGDADISMDYCYKLLRQEVNLFKRSNVFESAKLGK